MDRPEYGSLDFESRQRNSRDSETRTGAVKHNGLIGQDEGKLPCELHARQPKVTEPAATMADNLLAQAGTESEAVAVLSDGSELLDAFMGRAFEEKPIWVGLWESLRDVFFPQKLPPLVLTSTPIPVPDRMAVKPNPWAIGISTTINLTILLIALFFVGKKIIDTYKPAVIATDIDVSDFKALKSNIRAGGGGGGGDHSIIDPTKGKLPKLEKNPVVPPQVQTFDKPKLVMDAAIDVQKNITLPDNPMLPNIGMKSGINVVLSNGQGSGGGMGTGSGGGLGSGNGNGYGPGTGGNTGGGLYRIGGGVSQPVLVHSVDPEFSDEARRAKYQGICLISIIVDAQGNPQNPRIVRALGMGLDEKALEAIKQFKFKPAMKDGKTPVPVMMTVEVNFRLY